MRGWLLGLLLMAATAPACDSDHSALAKGSNRTGGVGGAGSGGSGGSQAGFTMVPQNGGTVSRSTGGRPPDESPGDNVLTLVHGIVDAKSTLVCFIAGSGADARVLDTEPTPLDYGQSLVLTNIEGVDLKKDALEPVVIAGDLDEVSGLGCADALELARKEQGTVPSTSIDGAGGGGGAGGASSGGATAAGGQGGASSEEGGASAGSGGEGGAGMPRTASPKLRVGELPIIPAGTIAGGRSYLLVGTGCIGGPGVAGKYAQTACGEQYSPAAPTLGGVLVALSRRTAFGSLGLQVVHASAATGTVNVFASRVLSEENQWIGTSLEFGALVPRVAQPSLAAQQYGVDSAFWQIEVLSDFTALFAERWTVIKKRAALDTLVDGRSYTVILLGPAAGFARKGFWNPPAITVVPNDPTRPAD